MIQFITNNGATPHVSQKFCHKYGVKTGELYYITYGNPFDTGVTTVLALIISVKEPLKPLDLLGEHDACDVMYYGVAITKRLAYPHTYLVVAFKMDYSFNNTIIIVPPNMSLQALQVIVHRWKTDYVWESLNIRSAHIMSTTEDIGEYTLSDFTHLLRKK